MKFSNRILSLFAGAILLAIPFVTVIAAQPVVTVCGPSTIEVHHAKDAAESAHAIAACHIGNRKLPLAGHEYVAYVTMLATMEEGTRDRVLEANPGTGFDHPAQINDLRYVLGQEQFGVESYRHWLALPDPPGFLRRLLAGEVVMDPPM